MENKNIYLSLEALSAMFGLPQTYLKRLADNKAIPFLDVGGRRKFNVEQVAAVLKEFSSSQKKK